MEESISKMLKEFTKEDNEIQEILSSIVKHAESVKISPKQNDVLSALVTRAKAALIVKKSYQLTSKKPECLTMVMSNAQTSQSCTRWLQ